MRNVARLVLSFGILLASSKGFGVDTIGPTFNLDLDFGFTTYKSKLVANNDTSTSSGYSIGAFAGAEHQLNMLIRVDANSTGFTNPDTSAKSKIVSTLQETILRYMWGPTYFGIVFDQTSFVIKKDDADYLSAIGLGQGFNAGLRAEVGKGNLVIVDYTSATTASARESLLSDKTFGIGPRTDIYMGGSIRLSPQWLNFLVGYRTRGYSFKVGGASFAEAQSSTLIGFRVNASF